MALPSQMSLRRIPDALHLQVRIAYAAAWETLVDTYARQALEFVCEFASRIPALEAMDLFFLVTAVPEPMHEVVRCRALTALDLETLPQPANRPQLTGWRRFRPDLRLEQRRANKRYGERTLELAKMVGARATEAVIITHVENAVDFTRLLKGVMTVNEAADHYLIEFTLPEAMAHMVSQRVRARVAGEELTAQYDELPLPAVEEREPAPQPEPAEPLVVHDEEVRLEIKEAPPPKRAAPALEAIEPAVLKQDPIRLEPTRFEPTRLEPAAQTLPVHKHAPLYPLPPAPAPASAPLPDAASTDGLAAPSEPEAAPEHPDEPDGFPLWPAPAPKPGPPGAPHVGRDPFHKS